MLDEPALIVKMPVSGGTIADIEKDFSETDCSQRRARNLPDAPDKVNGRASTGSPAHDASHASILAGEFLETKISSARAYFEGSEGLG